MKEVRYLWQFPNLIDQGKGIQKTSKKLLKTFTKIFDGIAQNVIVCFNPKTIRYEVYVTIRYEEKMDKGDNANGNK